MRYVIDNMKQGDWKQVRLIYDEGISSGHATFESAPPNWKEWDSVHLKEPRLVARTDDCIAGWAALSPVSSRCVYFGAAEVSLYVSARFQGKGVGSALLAALIDSSEKAGIWTLQGGIFPENTASLGLFKKHGFRELGRKEKLGKMTYGELDGTWRDVILLERRSKVAGSD